MLGHVALRPVAEFADFFEVDFVLHDLNMHNAHHQVKSKRISGISILHAMKFDDRPDFAKRLETARIARNFETAKDAARYFGWTYETYIQHEQGIRGISRAASKYAKAFRVSEGWLLTGEGQGPTTTNIPKFLHDTTIPIGMVPITGRVAANTWLSVDDMDFGYDDIEYVPSLGNYPLEWQFGLLIDGNCLNKIAAHGERLICLNTIAAGVEIEDGDLAIVERKRFNGQMVERTAKRVRRAADGFELWPESTDPAHQDPIRLYRVPEGEEISVIGKVLWIMKKP